MFRKSVRVASRLAVSAALSWTLIPIAIADAPAPAETESAAAPEAAPEAGEPSAKRLFTVPEDGMGDEHWLSGATRYVREILLQRPNEDLVICVAGCIAKQDRVVYAQPAEPKPPKPAVMSDSKPVAPSAASANDSSKPAADARETPVSATDKADVTPAIETNEARPAIAPAADAAPDQGEARLDFVPSMAVPGEPDGEAAAPATAAPSADQPAGEAQPAAEAGEPHGEDKPE